MAACPNTSSPQWKELVNKIGIKEAYREFIKNNYEVPSASLFNDTYSGVNATTKIVGALMSPAGSKGFNQFYLTGNKEKFFADLSSKHGATKQQVENLKVWMDANSPKTIEDLLTGLMAETTYTIKINTATSNKSTGYEYDEDGHYIDNSGDELGDQQPTQHYSNLTVPGGTNYTENEISTPAIVPAIKGHGQFSTDKGIGWFRSDDKKTGRTTNDHMSEEAQFSTPNDYTYYQYLQESGELVGDKLEEFNKLKEQDLKNALPTKTRRILEVQSDLFQKGRDREDLAKENLGEAEIEYTNKEDDTAPFYYNFPDKQDINTSNQFLQLLNKENNWVNFFIQAIIQDSQFKGYEKVMFPTGNTAAKVEGHGTLEDFIKDKENRLLALKTKISKNGITYTNEENKFFRENASFGKQEISEEDYNKRLEANKTEIEQIEKELDDARNGRAKFSSIAAFYENAVYNILKKKGYNPVKVTDEHGNTWNQVDLNADRDSSTIYFNRESDPQIFQDKALDHLSKQELLSSEKIKTKDGEFPVVSSTNRTVSENVAEIEKINQEFADKYGWKPYIVEELSEASPVFIVKVASEGAVFTEDNEGSIDGTMKQIADELSKKLGVEYEYISAAEARRLTKDSKIPWQGENAFYYNDKVYFVKGQATKNDALHEFAHPFVMAIRKGNPGLYNRILADIMESDDPFYQNIVDSVNENYDDVSDDARKDEMIVRALQLVGSGYKVQGEAKNIFQKIIYAIKQLLRKIFGESINLDNLSPTTTLEELSDILYNKEQKVTLTKSSEEVGDVFFNREIAIELSQLHNDVNVKHINAFFVTIQDHVRKLKDEKNYGELAKVLETPSSNIPKNVETLLALAKEFENNASMQQRKLENFAQGVLGIESISKEMKKHVQDMVRSGVKEQDMLRTMRYYSFIMNDWLQVFDQLREDNNHKDLPLLGASISTTISNFKTIEDEIDRVNRKGLSQFYTELLAPIRENILKDIDDNIALLQKVHSEGRDMSARIKELQKSRTKYDFDEATMLKYLRGEMGDTNAFSAFFESYTSSPDPIVGGLAVHFSNNFNKVLSDIQQISTKLGNELAPHYKAFGVNRGDPEQLGKQLVTIEKVYSEDPETREPVGYDVNVLMHEFTNGWLYDYKVAQDKIEKAKIKGDKDEERKYRKELEQLKEDYFNREYKDVVYKAKKFWSRDRVTELAQERRKDITDQLKGFDAFQVGEITMDYLEEIDRLKKQLRTFASTKNLDGSEKQGDDLLVANAIKEYNELSRDLYEEVEIKDAFNRALEDFKFFLREKGIAEGSEEYVAKLNAWIKENIRISPTDQFFEDRAAIYNELDSIFSQISSKENKEAQSMEVGKLYEGIFEQLKGLRDQNGQPIGYDLSDSKLAEIKKSQEQILAIRDKFRKMGGLNLEEDAEMDAMIDVLLDGRQLTIEQQKRYAVLTAKRTIDGLDKASSARVAVLFKQLNDLQSKIPTEYYMDIMNSKLRNIGSTMQITQETSEQPLFVEKMNEILDKNEDFKKWFLNNHIINTKWDQESGTVNEVYERIYAWNRIVPRDATLMEALRTNDYQKLINYNSKYVSTKKASKYYFYRIKDIHKNERVIGENVDNRGNWLPRTMAQGAKDNKYENKEFFRLKNSIDAKDKALFNILQIYKKYHLKNQEEAPRYTRLYYELPRLRKQRVEEFNALQSDPGSSITRIWDYASRRFSRKSGADDFDRGEMSPKDIKDEAKLYVATDLWGDRISSIPIKYMSKLEADKVSLDVGRSIMKYGVSARNNKMLHDINPVAHALQSVLDSEGIKELNFLSRLSITKNLNINVKGKDNIRAMAVKNMIEKYIDGVDHKMEFGVFGQRMFNHIAGMAAFGSIALNIPAGIKNAMSANIQNTIEAVGGQSYTLADVLKANRRFLYSVLPKIVDDYNKFSGRSLYTQMFELFDPVEGKFAENIGNSFSASYKKDIVNLRFLTSPQKFGEIQAQGVSMLAMMEHTMIDQTIDGVTNKISYADAWEIREGVISLKPGIDPQWDRGGKNFLAFKLKLNKVNELLQGAYAEMNQPEAMRYTTFQMLFFMRRYLAPGIVNRYSPNRPNFAIGSLREGYYRSFFKVISNMFKTKRVDWDTYTEKEKKGFMKSLTEIGYSLAFGLLISFMGYHDDDKDKYSKLRNSSWAHNMALYELIMIKGEAETFLPLPGMGMNEILRMKDNPSVAFPILNKYNKILEHLWDTMRDPFVDQDVSHYQRKTGMYERGELKLKADLLKLIGVSGTSMHPELGIRNYSTAMSRY